MGARKGVEGRQAADLSAARRRVLAFAGAARAAWLGAVHLRTRRIVACSRVGRGTRSTETAWVAATLRKGELHWESGLPPPRARARERESRERIAQHSSIYRSAYFEPYMVYGGGSRVSPLLVGFEVGGGEEEGRGGSRICARGAVRQIRPRRRGAAPGGPCSQTVFFISVHRTRVEIHSYRVWPLAA